MCKIFHYVTYCDLCGDIVPDEDIPDAVKDLREKKRRCPEAQREQADMVDVHEIYCDNLTEIRRSSTFSCENCIGDSEVSSKRRLLLLKGC